MLIRLIGLCSREISNSLALPYLQGALTLMTITDHLNHYDIENASEIAPRAFEAAQRGFRSMKTVLLVTLTTDIPTDYRLTSTWSKRY